MISAIQLSKQYGDKQAVDSVSFEVRKGDVLGFLGPNGAGKSTTMKMLTGFLKPTAGTAKIGGFDIGEKPAEAKKLFGYLPESGPLYDEMTVDEFLRFIAGLRGVSSVDQAMSRVITTCHLEEVIYQPIDTLSKGYRQRVGMAQSIIHDPQALILDEPTDGLDPNQKRGVRRLISSMASEKAIILSTHILEEVEAMCNRIIIIANGKMIVDESPQKLRKRHPHFGGVYIDVESNQKEVVKNTLKTLKPVKNVQDEEGKLLVLSEKGEALDPIILDIAREKNWHLKSIVEASSPLEEVFADLTK